MRQVRHHVDELRQALADTIEDPRLNLYWFNLLHGSKDRVVNVRQNRQQLQVKQADGHWYAITDPGDRFTLE